MHTTPVSLLEQLRQPGSAQAWGRFAELYTPLLYHWARSQGLDEADAADLVQEVFRLLLAKLPNFRYRQDGSFRAWLRTLTFNKHRELLWKRRPALADHLDEQTAPDASSALEEKEHRLRLVQRMLHLLKEEFPPGVWRIFHEHVVEGRDAQAVATARNVTLGAVYAAKSKVLLRLRRELAGLLEPG